MIYNPCVANTQTIQLDFHIMLMFVTITKMNEMFLYGIIFAALILFWVYWVLKKNNTWKEYAN